MVLPMQVILYHQLNPKNIPNFPKMKGYLEAGDFRSADVKKVGHNLYRARLDHSNRLVFSLYRSHDHVYILVLECIAPHRNDKALFLHRGSSIDGVKLPAFGAPV